MNTDQPKKCGPDALPDWTLTFGARCAELGMAAWRVGPENRTEEAPTERTAFGDWLRTEPIRTMVDQTLAQAGLAQPAAHATSILNPLPGCWIIFCPPTRNNCAQGGAVMALGSEFLASDLFDAACRACGRSAAEAASALGASCAHSAESVRRDARMVAWMHEDLVAGARKDASLHGFGLHLSEMYEEIGLLYRLGRSMNQLARPEDFVENACADLQQSTLFQWVGARFAESDRTAAGVAGDLVLSGSLPCDADEFDRGAALLLQSLPHDRWSLLTPREGVNDLAGLVGSEVLAHPISRDGRVIGALLAGNKTGDDPAVSSFETQLLDAAADYLRVFIENSDLYSDQNILFVGTVEALAASIDAKDSYTCGHSQRVAHLGRQLALEIGLGDEAAERVRIAGLLHDVGKIGVPEVILCKPGRLTDDEFAQIKKHPEMGQRILKDIPFLEDILPAVLYHHERPDGRGYPEGLSGHNIPLIARLLGIADAFDAMSSSRSYRAAMPREKVLGEVHKGAGSQFDPELVPYFVAMDFAEYDRMVASSQRSLAAAA